MSKSSDEFVNWLHKKLNELKTDPGILSEDETREEKTEALQDLLSEITEKDLQNLLTAILDKWEECHKIAEEEPAEKPPSIDVNEQLAKLLEVQRIQAVIPERKYTEEERRLKEQILAQYAQTEISDDDDYDDGTGDAKEHKAASSSGIERNTNLEDVLQLQKEKREQARLDSAAKKQKDKEDREKQRQLREEKKEKRKTVKGERRR